VSWTVKEMWFDTWQRQEIFPVPKCADQLCDPPSISLILRTPSPAVKQRGHDTDQSPSCSVKVKNWNGPVGLPPLLNVP